MPRCETGSVEPLEGAKSDTVKQISTVNGTDVIYRVLAIIDRDTQDNEVTPIAGRVEEFILNEQQQKKA